MFHGALDSNQPLHNWDVQQGMCILVAFQVIL